MKILIFILLFTLLLVYGCQKSEMNQPKVLDNPKEECSRVNGEWKIFSDGCVDSCFKARSKEPVFCTLALKEGCNCGPERCWNGKTCEAN